MARKLTFQKTKPYAQITINVYPDFIPRLTTTLVGIRGTTSNLSPAGYWAFLFEVNEYLPKECKLTDYQIARAVVNEFPQRESYRRILDRIAKRVTNRSQRTVASYRSSYNTGRLLPLLKGRKGPISFRYNEKGERLSSRVPTKLLSEKELADMLARYGPDERQLQPFDFSYRLVKNPRNKGGRPSYKSFDWCI